MKKISLLIVLVVVLFLPITFLFHAPANHSPISITIASAQNEDLGSPMSPDNGDTGTGNTGTARPKTLGNTGGLVPCNGPDCTICSFFQLLTNIYVFIVWDIATPLAVVALVIGGIFILLSAGNPQGLGTGKKIIYSAIIGLVLVFCSYIIIDTVLHIIGYSGSWANLQISCT